MSSTMNPNPAADITAWHAMSVDAVVKRLATDTGKGLDAAEAANRLQNPCLRHSEPLTHSLNVKCAAKEPRQSSGA
jgi:hypothetical protein